MAALYSDGEPMPKDLREQEYRALQDVPFRKPQHELPLAIPEADTR